LAATLQAGLESFATPWFRSRTLRVFRDTTDLSATPDLLSEITVALNTASWFILVASKQAAQSRWVGEEVSRWLANKDPKRFLIALTDGEIVWAGQDFDWNRTTALPGVLAGAFTEEPGWIDLRDVKRVLAEGSGAAAHGRLRRLTRYQARPQVGDWVAALGAPIRGVPKDSLVGQHLRYRKHTRRIVQATLAVLLFLAAAASAAAAVAGSQLVAARTQNRIATSRELSALSETLLTRHLDLAELFAVEAYQLNPGGQALAALFQAVTADRHLVTYLAAGGNVSAVAGSADGRVIVAGRSDGEVLRWSLPDTKPAVIARMTHAVTGVAVSGDGTAAVAVGQVAALRWDRGRGVRMLRLVSAQRPMAASISPSGHFVAVASAPPREALDGIRLTIFGSDARMVNATGIANGASSRQYVSFSGDSQVTIMGSDSGAWRRLSVPDLRLLGGRDIEIGNEDTAALSPGGRFVGSSNRGRVLSFRDITKQPNAAGGNEITIDTHVATSSALAINRQGTLIAQAAGGLIYVTGITRGRVSSTPLVLAGNSVFNYGDLAFAGRDELVSASGNLLTLWNLRQFSRIATETSISAPQGCNACGGPMVSVKPGGGRMAVMAGGGSTVTVQDLPSGAKSTQSSATPGTYGSPLWTPDGKRLFVPTDNGGANIWSAAPNFVPVGKWSHTIPQKSAAGNSPAVSIIPIATEFRPDGKTVVEVFPNGAIMLRDGTTGKIEKSIAGPSSLVDGLVPSFSASVDTAGQWAAVVTAHGVVVTSIATGRGHTLPGSSADKVAYDGERLLVQQPDGPLQIWDAGAAHLAKTIAGVADTVAGPAGNRDGLIAETSPDGSAVIIDLDSGSSLGSVGLPAGIFFYSAGIGMPAYGGSLVTVTEATGDGSPGTLTDWQMSATAWLKVACDSAGHALSDADWQEYVGGSPPAQLACSGEPPEVST
jgi:WD40 repeat protein